MNRNSEELKRRISVMMAYQNGETMQYRNRVTGSVKEGDWLDLRDGGNLSFNWERCDFRVKPVLREGYVFARSIHQHPKDHAWKQGDETCFPVREVEFL